MQLDTLTDAIGVRHEPVTAPARIVSLVPSITELLFVLKLGDQLVGRTHYCVHPPHLVAKLPSVGGTKKVRYARLQALQPTHVIVNVDENPRELAERLMADGYKVIVTHPLTPEDNVPLYRLIGGIFNRTAEAEALAGRFERTLAELRQAVWPQRRVLYLIWRKPWMGISRETYISKMLGLVGWETLPVESEARYPKLEITPTLLGSVDLVLFSSEPYRFVPEDLETFARDYDCPLEKLRLIDGEMSSWYGSRAIQGLQYLQQLVREY
ncbi:putative periplasmic metal binding protein [Candidatus Competibacter denitrificans Run_A_D11]|uniref:Periplasmic metal binding protein n=1 Tax=Candidatus Competibacter denitrificans Run_A_D11 TaxID=1400863 RepID=W6M567_9GAMM|nr:helical backbone metal receptor [Candidatus Competibacter denitrificans]CDI00945.1 putative periplasmic metal binding protein [Candidatus Competibacter denitrificans Run_A_D11]